MQSSVNNICALGQPRGWGGGGGGSVYTHEMLNVLKLNNSYNLYLLRDQGGEVGNTPTSHVLG